MIGIVSQRDLANSVVQFTAMQNDIVMFEDFDHGSKNIQGFMFGNDNIDALAKGGVKNLCIEVPSFAQPMYDALGEVGKASAERRDKMTPEEKKQFDKKADQATDKYAKNMSEKYRPTGIEDGSKAEFEYYKKEAESIIYAGSKGIKVHAVDTGVDPEKKDGKYDFTKREQADAKVADKVAKIAEKGKTAVVYGAAHSARDQVGKNKDLEDHLQDKGLKVGRIGVIENQKAINQVLHDGTRVDGNNFKYNEVPNTIIKTNSNAFGGMQVAQLQTDGKNREIGGEINRESEEASRTKYKDVKEKDLGNLPPPTARQDGHEAHKAEKYGHGPRS